MKILTLNILNCKECPYFRALYNADFELLGYRCSKLEKDIINFTYGDFICPPKIEDIAIPDWCPLEELK